jgi:alpha-beta hydrolase superfamily lysophospholipase
MPRPASRSGTHDGLAYDLWLPEAEAPWPGVVVLHGAGSRKENHADFARAASARGWAALAFDARGHGESTGAMSATATADVLTMVELLAGTEGVDRARIVLRGSSMGGFLAIHAATSPKVAGVFAICPAGEGQLLRGLRRDDLAMQVEREALEGWLAAHDIRSAVEALAGKPVVIMHAKGDEDIPYTQSEELFARASDPRKLVIVPGGDHRSAQHDPELQAVGLRWLERELGLGSR